MEKIKELLANWNLRRSIQIAFSIFLLISYLENREPFFILGAIFFAVQGIFNIGCASGNCSSTNKTTNSPIIKTEKYIPKK